MQMRLRLATIASVLASAISPASAGDKPNVILILTDDQGYGDLACHGNPVIKTPNLDRLYANSVRLTDFHVSPACAPTRAALMTGRWPSRVGVWHVVMGRCLLHPDEVTMADIFRECGYKTAIFGKWHLGDNYPFRPQDRGFQEVLVHGGGVVGHTPDYWLNDYFDDTYLHNGKWQQVSGYCTDVWFDGTIEFVERNKDAPFFVYLSTNTPHQPFLVEERYEAMYRGKEGVPNAAFYGMITRIDENVGRLQRELKRLGLEDNTLLVFMTDNGTSAGIRWTKGGKTVGYNAGMRGKKASAYDGGHRVPCWFYWPGGGLEGGRDIDRLADHVDILPTLADLCGLRVPKETRFDGTSLVPLLRRSEVIETCMANESRATNGSPDPQALTIELPSISCAGINDWPDRVLVAELQLVVDRPVKWRRCAVMTDRWRLVDGRELYDVKADPGQRQDIAQQRPEVVARLRAEYEKWWASVSQTHDRIPEIVLGSERENPTMLTAYHWNNGTGQQRDMPWAHAHIVAGPHQNGSWWVNVSQSGTYEFRLHRWPEESGLAINQTSDAEPPEKPWHALEPGSLVATRARLKIQDIDVTQPVEKNAEEVRFKVHLNAGSAVLQTWFLDREDNSRGAYYVSAALRP